MHKTIVFLLVFTASISSYASTDLTLKNIDTIESLFTGKNSGLEFSHENWSVHIESITTDNPTEGLSTLLLICEPIKKSIKPKKKFSLQDIISASDLKPKKKTNSAPCLADDIWRGGNNTVIEVQDLDNQDNPPCGRLYTLTKFPAKPWMYKIESTDVNSLLEYYKIPRVSVSFLKCGIYDTPKVKHSDDSIKSVISNFIYLLKILD